MSTDSTAPNEVERRRQRLPEDHPAVERLRVLRAAVAKLQAVAAAARPEHTLDLAAALAALDEAANGGAAPAVIGSMHDMETPPAYPKGKGDAAG